MTCGLSGFKRRRRPRVAYAAKLLSRKALKPTENRSKKVASEARRDVRNERVKAEEVRAPKPTERL